MNRRHALSIAAAATLSLTGLGAAVGATTQIFSAADATDLGTISPVSSPTLPPLVEHQVLDVQDPAPAPTPLPAPSASGTTGSNAPGSDERVTAASAPTPAGPEDDHGSGDEVEHEAGHEAADD